LNSQEGAVKLSILLVNHNDRANLGGCLESVREHVLGIAYEIVVVDNASSDGSQNFLRERFPEVRLFCNDVNTGFSQANNRGIRECKGEYLLLLNTDTVLLPQAVGLMLEALKADPEVGAAGPALLSGENTFQVSFGNKVDFFHEMLQKTILNLFYKVLLKKSRSPRKVEWLSAACLCVRAKVLQEVGCFDENYFLYFEDIDLCVRIRKRGYSLLFIPEARVLHLGGAVTAKDKLGSRYHYRRSQLYFYKKHNAKANLILLRAYLRFSFRLGVWRDCLRRSPDLDMRRKFLKLLKEK